MATKSFFRNNVIKGKREAMDFLNALEEAEKAPKKNIKVKFKTIRDEETIKKIFSNKENG